MLALTCHVGTEARAPASWVDSSHTVSQQNPAGQVVLSVCAHSSQMRPTWS